MPNSDAMAQNHEAQQSAIDRLTETQQQLEDQLVTAPAVGEKQDSNAARIEYLLVRNNEYQLGLMVEQYGLRKTVAMLTEAERALQRHMERNGNEREA